MQLFWLYPNRLVLGKTLAIHYMVCRRKKMLEKFSPCSYNTINIDC
jgi:hypothetical protein